MSCLLKWNKSSNWNYNSPKKIDCYNKIWKRYNKILVLFKRWWIPWWRRWGRWGKWWSLQTSTTTGWRNSTIYRWSMPLWRHKFWFIIRGKKKSQTNSGSYTRNKLVKLFGRHLNHSRKTRSCTRCAWKRIDRWCHIWCHLLISTKRKPIPNLHPNSIDMEVKNNLKVGRWRWIQ